MSTVITCERCGRTTADPDRWDPEADTGRIFCDRCWDLRDEPQGMIAPPAVGRHTTHVEVDARGYYFWCEADDCYASGGRHATLRSAADAAALHEAWPG